MTDDIFDVLALHRSNHNRKLAALAQRSEPVVCLDADGVLENVVGSGEEPLEDPDDC